MGGYPVLMLLGLAIVYAGVAQSQSGCNPVDVALILDAAAPPGTDESGIKSALKAFVDTLFQDNPDARVLLLQYALSIQRFHPFSIDKDQIKDNIDTFVFQFPGRDVNGALSFFSQVAQFRSTADRVGLVVTFGEDNTDFSSQITIIGQNNVNMFAVGVGSAVGSAYLNAISSDDSQTVTSGFDELESSLTSLSVSDAACGGTQPGWSEWATQSTGDCSTECGTGSRELTQTRMCDNPPPQDGGPACTGDSSRVITESCFTPCWSEWTTQSAGDCSEECGTGSRELTQTRTCDNPPPQDGGPTCTGDSSRVITESCFTPCWSEWTTQSAGDCSEECGTGSRELTQTRTCDNPPPQDGGPTCTGDSSRVITESCFTPCWSEWTTQSAGPCSVACGTGSRSVDQTRVCNNPPPQSGDQTCIGDSTRTTTEQCVINCPACEGCSVARGFLAHPTDCRYYLHCANSVLKQIRKCQGNRIWSHIQHRCVSPSNSNCVTTMEIDPATCKKSAVSNQPGKYSLILTGIGEVLVDCVPGKIFSPPLCTCIPAV